MPYNPYNLRYGRWGEAIVAGAGPLTNIVLALVFGLLIRFGLLFNVFTITSPVITLATFVVYINILLAIFNMIPVPPLDGSKILAAVLPNNAHRQYMHFQETMARLGMVGMLIFFFVFIYFLWPIISVVNSFFFTLITGL